MAQTYSPFPQDPESYSSQGRPIYKKLPLSIFDKILIGLIGVVVISAWIITTIPLRKIDNPIVTHFDNYGKPDVYHKKSIFLWIPALISIYVLLSEVLCLFLHKVNLTCIPITRENAQRIYMTTRLILRYNCFCAIGSFLLYWILWMNAVIRHNHNLNHIAIWSTLGGCFGVCFIGTAALVYRTRKADEEANYSAV